MSRGLCGGGRSLSSVKMAGAFIISSWATWHIGVSLFHSPDADSVKFLSCWATGFLLSPHPSPASSLTSFCRSIFRVHSNTLSLSCLPSLAVPLTYFMAHRQRQEECLLLSVVSRSVGQHRRMRASFPPAFVSRPPLPASLYENYSWVGFFLWGEGGVTFHFSTSVGCRVQILA